MGSHSNILFIVEGSADEGRLLRKINGILDSKNIYSIYTYKTTIHEMYDICIELINDKDLSLQLLLKEKTSDASERSVLSKQYKSIFLIFDFDPHYPKYSSKKLLMMYDFYNESRDFGRLYINYPMMQSYRHMKKMPDVNFIKSTASLGDCLEYKKIVGQESNYTDLNAYDYQIIMNLVYHHYCKLNYISTKCYSIKDLDDFLQTNQNKLKSLLVLQNDMFEATDKFYIINTSILFIIDLNPITFFRKIRSILL